MLRGQRYRAQSMTLKKIYDFCDTNSLAYLELDQSTLIQSSPKNNNNNNTQNSNKNNKTKRGKND